MFLFSKTIRSLTMNTPKYERHDYCCLYYMEKRDFVIEWVYSGTYNVGVELHPHEVAVFSNILGQLLILNGN